MDIATVTSLPHKASQKPVATPSFSKPESVGPRPWGEELKIGLLPGQFVGKVLKTNKGKGGRLQIHHKKHEIHYVVSGKILYTYDDGTGNLYQRTLVAGDCVDIPPGAVHQELALEDSVVFEMSTPHFNDRCGVEERYGIAPPEGEFLPSTTPEEVQIR